MIMKKKITNKDIIDGSFVIPEGATEIRDYAFYGCSSLTNITLPESVTKIGNGAFRGCRRKPQENHRENQLFLRLSKKISKKLRKKSTQSVNHWKPVTCRRKKK